MHRTLRHAVQTAGVLLLALVVAASSEAAARRVALIDAVKKIGRAHV